MKGGKNILENKLESINKRGYKAYRGIEGSYEMEDMILHIDHVQGDPFAAPSRLRITVDNDKAAFPHDTFEKKPREIALRDLITRRFYSESRKVSKCNKGSGKSGTITIDRPGQEILDRTSVLVDDGVIEARVTAGLPAFGRRIAGYKAMEMLLEEIPEIVRRSLFFESFDREEIYRHVECKEDSTYLRDQLVEMDLVAFVADGSILPRRSGVDDRPMERGAISFISPDSMRVDMDLPNQGNVTGMGVEKGISLIVGGGYHGKSTLLRAIELGIYDHIPGDGRERVVTDPDAMKVRAEDGRSIQRCDISPFISNLPFGEDTSVFTSGNASGSTSQAANIIEALEAGSSTLLVDEDTSATNFMIRDHRMQELVRSEKEPITPFIDKVRPLFREHGVSSVIVVGGSGDYFDVADRVICMDNYLPEDVTERAMAIASALPTRRKDEGGESFGNIRKRIPVREGFDPGKGRKKVNIKTRGWDTIIFGTTSIDLIALEQLVDASQTRAIADAVYLSTSFMTDSSTLKEVCDRVMELIMERGLDALCSYPNGSYASFRGLELAFAINRMRTLKMK